MQKEPFKFRSIHKREMLKALRHAKADIDEMAALRALEAIVAESSLRSRKDSVPLAIEDASILTYVMVATNTIHSHLNAAAMGNRNGATSDHPKQGPWRTLAKALGRNLDVGKDKRFEAGAQRMREYLEDTDDVCDACLAAHDAVSDELWQGDRREDRALRRLSRRFVAKWKDLTDTPIADVAFSSDWRPHIAGTEPGTWHPLWLMLEAIGVNVGPREVHHLVRYARDGIKPGRLG